MTRQFDGITTLGLGVPGLFDPDAGSIELFPNLVGQWEGYELRDKVSRGIGLDATMVNDARAFTLAEGTVGAGRGAKVMLGITLGTGIGGGVMIDGHLHTGAFGTAGEFGHQTVSPEGPMCGCGNRGCLEAVARGGVISTQAGAIDVEELYAAAAEGNELAVRTVERASFFMAIAIANAVSLLGVDVVVVGGGIVSSGDRVLDPLRSAVAERVTLVPTDGIRIIAAELGPMAGAIGAALAGMSQEPMRSL
jgi:glucokinase